MSSTNQAAWLDGKGAQLRVGEAPMPKAGVGQIVIRNKAIAVNPVDWKVQDYGGFFVKQWPMVLGTDVAGEVTEVGEGVEGFEVGDRIAAHMISLLSGNSEDGGFQLFSAAVAGKAAKLPSNVSFNEGSVIPLALDTAAVGLYSAKEDGYLGLSLPSLNPSDASKTIVVWGGSSSVGALVIQLAVASGVKVVAVASERNFDFCKKLGASEVLDYKNKDSIVEDVVKAVQKVGGAFVGVYDAISEAGKSYDYTLPIAEKLEGNVACVLPPPGEDQIPGGVKCGGIMGLNDLTHQIWSDYVTKALESGKLKCVPEPLIVGKGLEAVQKGLDTNKAGVSAKKVVIEL